MFKFKYILLPLIGFMICACSDDFGKLNTDPTRAGGDIFDPNLLLPTMQTNYEDGMSGYSGPILFQSMWTQILASTSTLSANYYSGGDKYVQSTNTFDYVARTWQEMYEVSSYAAEIAQLSGDNEQYRNVVAASKILQVMAIASAADVYGHVPYSEASKAKEGITQPKYDTQSELFPQLLSDLDLAISNLSTSYLVPTNDAYYDGNIEKWIKFGNSLMLKIAMHLTEVAPDVAQQYAEKAVSAGTFESTADDCILLGEESNGFTNNNSNALGTGGDLYEVRWSKVFIDFMKSVNDPKLKVIAEIPPTGLAGNQTGGLVGNSDPNIQQGMPNGYTLVEANPTYIGNEPDFPGGNGEGDDFTPIGNYSRPTNMYRDRSAPFFVLTYAETQLWMAEMAIRGWNTPNDAATHFANALTAGVLSLSKYGDAGVITEAEAELYTNDNPLNTSSDEEALKMIGYHFWNITGTQLNWIEAWNNWRRTGYPELQPVNFTGNFSNGQIPLREPYPNGEATLNNANNNAAVSVLGGPDNWNTSIWWDK